MYLVIAILVFVGLAIYVKNAGSVSNAVAGLKGAAGKFTGIFKQK